MKFDNLHQILRSLYEQMMPLCGDMAGVAKGIAGLGALFYVAYRVWQSLARAEPIDVFPMLRPFAIGLCIMFFPTVVLGTINSILSPVVQGTAKMLEAETLDKNLISQHCFPCIHILKFSPFCRLRKQKMSRYSRVPSHGSFCFFQATHLIGKSDRIARSC